MIELSPNQFSVARALFDGIVPVQPLMLAVVEGSQPGRVFVDRAANPRSAMVCNRFGFMTFLGESHNKPFNDSIEELLFLPASLEQGYMLWCAPPEAWRERLMARCNEENGARWRTRIRFRFDGRRFNGGSPKALNGVRIERIDFSALRAAADLGLDIGGRFWESESDFLRHRLGVVATKNEKVVAVCYAACEAGGLAEVDIATDEAHRGSGLATAVGREFVQLCLGQGVEPTWDCFDYNEASMRLAVSLGFEEERHYDFFSFNRPTGLGKRLDGGKKC